jgi:hypothetical protein
MARKPPAPGKRQLEEMRAQAAQDPHLERELQALAHLIDGEQAKRGESTGDGAATSGRGKPGRRKKGDA